MNIEVFKVSVSKLLVGLLMLGLSCSSMASSLGTYHHIVDGLERYQFDLRPSAPGAHGYLLNKQRMMGKSKQVNVYMELIGTNLDSSVEKAVLDVQAVKEEQQALRHIGVMKAFIRLLMPSFKDVDGKLAPLLDKAFETGPAAVESDNVRMVFSFNHTTRAFILTATAI